MTPEERKRKKEGRCRHFTGIMNRTCKDGVEYDKFLPHLPCFGERSGCSSYSPLTPDELAQEEAALQRHMDLMRKGLSGCCEAPFDTSQVITKGQFKNHGPRFCSKCGKLAFMV